MDGQAKAYRIVLAQFAVTVVVCSGFLAFSGLGAGLSALLGGLINVVANLYLVRTVFGGRGPRSSRQMVRAFYVGEVVKLLITASLFAVAILYLHVAFLPMLAGFVSTLLVFWFALLPWASLSSVDRS